jgi:ADP-heptose:LPS heptosyltransferase
MRGLKDQGYHVTVATNALGEEVLRNNPYIDAFVVENTPMTRDGYAAYFRRIGTQYDKVVNLDDSLEDLMVAQEGQKAFDYPTQARQFIFDKNYQELAHYIAGVPLDIRDSFFPAASENEWALKGRAFMAPSEPCVVWAVTGSGIYKVYPWVHVVAEWLTKEKVHVVFVGGPDSSKQLETGILQSMIEDGADTAYVHPCVGQWTIRESITFARHADCVVGPDTGLLHGVGMTTVPKVVFLSCSSPENLTKHWINTAPLIPDLDRCPCFPCHQNHHWWDSCNKDDENLVARCAASISPESAFEAIMAALPATS